MPGGRPPNLTRQRRNVPERGEWQAVPGVGWQHGPIPEPERSGDLSAESMRVWDVWMKAWWAAHWTPDDLPGLHVTIHLYEMVVDYQREPMIEKEYVTTKGQVRSTWVAKPNPTSELRQMMDIYGITPKGQQDRRWLKPDKAPDVPDAVVDAVDKKLAAKVKRGTYDGLKLVSG